MAEQALSAQPLSELDSWLRLERFDYSRVGEHWAVLRLLAGLGSNLGAPAEAMLVVQRGPTSVCGSAPSVVPGTRMRAGAAIARPSG